MLGPVTFTSSGAAASAAGAVQPQPSDVPVLHRLTQQQKLQSSGNVSTIPGTISSSTIAMQCLLSLEQKLQWLEEQRERSLEHCTRYLAEMNAAILVLAEEEHTAAAAAAAAAAVAQSQLPHSSVTSHPQTAGYHRGRSASRRERRQAAAAAEGRHTELQKSSPCSVPNGAACDRLCAAIEGTVASSPGLSGGERMRGDVPALPCVDHGSSSGSMSSSTSMIADSCASQLAGEQQQQRHGGNVRNGASLHLQHRHHHRHRHQQEQKELHRHSISHSHSHETSRSSCHSRCSSCSHSVGNNSSSVPGCRRCRHHSQRQRKQQLTRKPTLRGSFSLPTSSSLQADLSYYEASTPVWLTGHATMVHCKRRGRSLSSK